MTAEVVILNKSAAVLAADSAITIQTPQAKKTYNSASKIAALSRNPPIGAIVYGRADLLGVPWESIQRMYRDHMRSQRLSIVPDVENVAEGFFQWLEDSGERFFGDVCKARAADAADAMLDELHKALAAAGSDGSTTLDEVAAAFARSRMNEVAVFDDITDRRDVTARRDATFRQYHDLFDERIDRHGVGSFPLSRSTWRDVVGRLLADAVSHDALTADPLKSGIAFAGLGSNQFHPELVVYRVHGVLNNKVIRSERPRKIAISSDRPAHIEPLGQTAAIETFLQGINPQYQRRIDDVLAQLGQRLSKVVKDLLLSKNVLIDEHVPAIKKAMDVMINESLGQLLGIREQNPLPILEMIADLPTAGTGQCCRIPSVANGLVPAAWSRYRNRRPASGRGGGI